MRKPPVQRKTKNRNDPVPNPGEISEQAGQQQTPPEDDTTGAEGGGPRVGYGKNPHAEPPQMERKNR